MFLSWDIGLRAEKGKRTVLSLQNKEGLRNPIYVQEGKIGTRYKALQRNFALEGPPPSHTSELSDIEHGVFVLIPSVARGPRFSRRRSRGAVASPFLI